MQGELERGHDAEVAPPAADRPEQVRVLVLAGGDDLAVGEDHLYRDQVVTCEPVDRGRPAVAASCREAADAGARDAASRRMEAVRLRGTIELAPEDAAVGAGRAGHGIDVDGAH